MALSKKLRELKEYDLASQVFRSGTSVGANAHEAEAAQSKKDFAAKMSISSKEAREVLYWIRLMKASGFYDFDLDCFEKEAQDLVNIFTKIVKTTQENIVKERVKKC
jgi:four helix bundle protein